MKKGLLILWLCLFTALAMGQSWEVVKQGDAENDPSNGFFLDANNGWFVGNDGVVEHTNDGGLSGMTLREPDDSGIDWLDVKFANANVGYVSATDGYVFKTEDGGVTWTMIGDTATYKVDFNIVEIMDENTVYLAGDDGVLLYSTNGGTDWTKLAYTFDGEDLDGGLAFCDDPNIAVVATDANAGQTWYTHDGGTTWTSVILSFPPGTISSRIYDVDAVGDSTIVIAGYHYCMFVSHNGGKSYELAGDYTFDYERYQSVDALDANTLFAAGSGGHVVKTTDGGATVTVIDVPSGQSVDFVDFADADNGFVFSSSGQWFRTNDGGQTWTPILSWPNVSFWGLALPSDDKIVVTAFGGGEYSMSEDGGMTWTYPTNTLTGTIENLYECDFLNETTGLIGGGSGYMARTTDGGQSWTFVDNPMFQGSNLHINAIAFFSDNLALAGGSKGTIIKSTDGGQTWTEVYNEGGSTVYDFWQVSSKQIIASGSSGQIYLSNAALDTFTLANDYGSMSMRAVEFRGDVGLVAASSGNLFRTTVADWDTLVQVFDEPDGDDFYDVEFITDSLVYVVGEGGKIYHSEDAGQTWMADMSPTMETLQKVRYRNNRLWAVGKEGYVIMLDLTPPTPVTGLFINEFMAENDAHNTDENGEYDDWIEIYNDNDHPVDIGGLYITDDSANLTKYQIPMTAPDTTTIPPKGFLVLWADEQLNQGVLHVDIKLSAAGEHIALSEIFDSELMVIDSMTFTEQNMDTSYGRTSDGGMDWAYFKPASPGESNANGTVVSIEHRFDPSISDYHLAQNYPNPFNPTTTIEFNLKKAGKVNLTVYTVTGQKVATLVNQDMKQGSAKVVWDASGAASGVYFYQLTSGDFTSVKKMLLMK